MNTIKQLATFVIGFTAMAAAAAEPVTVLRVPDGGIQPQVAADTSGTVHLVYYKGNETSGDLFYVRSADSGKSFSAPLRVNSRPGSAVAMGNIRGARLAVGKNGRVHVAWNSSGSGNTPMLYARLNDAGAAFEPEHNVIQFAYGLDGGGAIAADLQGDVYVFWHAPAPGAEGEAARRVWMARSRDDGKTFEREKAVDSHSKGVCGCCGMEALADSKGSLYLLFRSATEMVHRDIYLLASSDHGENFRAADISPWNVGYCVMSSASFAEGAGSVAGAWEMEKQVYFGRVDSSSGGMSPPVAAPGSGENRKYPAVAVNHEGKTLLAWTEGMGWKKGGALAWQVFDEHDRAAGPSGKAPGVPVWSLVAAFARPDGGFTVVY